jgi:hypothetical protein
LVNLICMLIITKWPNMTVVPCTKVLKDFPSVWSYKIFEYYRKWFRIVRHNCLCFHIQNIYQYQYFFYWKKHSRVIYILRQYSVSKSYSLKLSVTRLYRDIYSFLCNEKRIFVHRYSGTEYIHLFFNTIIYSLSIG